ncbi:MAG TPA: hypothetical protein DCS15_08470 [Flavobacteriales bacterium]|nr:hypothetical protein [Flavobacteriales bacterium]
MKELVNLGTYVLNPSKQNSTEKTVVVLGIARSGTTMVAKVLKELGVFMGENDSPVVEDTELSKLLEQDRNIQKFEELVEERNEQHKVWGWKRPEAFRYIKLFENKIRNPHFIIVFRDPLAIGMRESISMQAELFQTMTKVQRRYTAIIRYLQGTDKTCLLVSYEKALQKQDAFVDSLVDYLGLDLKKKQIEAARKCIEIDSPIYLEKTSRKKHPRGAVLTSGNGSMKGWAYNGKNKQRQQVDVFVDGKLVDTIVAKDYRKGLEMKGIGDGHHAFTYDYSNHLKPSPKFTLIDFKIHETDIVLNNGPILNAQPLFFVHIPKVGGTSFRKMLFPKYKAQNIFPSARTMREHKGYPSHEVLMNLDEETLNDVQLIFGHYPFICAQDIGKSFLTACMFRNPYSRMVSNIFHFLRKNPETSAREIFEQRKAKTADTQVKYFADATYDGNPKGYSRKEADEADLKQAIENMKKLDFIGINERYDESLKLFEKTFNLDLGDMIMKNVGEGKDMSLFDDELVQEIKSSVALEQRFYDEVVLEYERRKSLAEQNAKDSNSELD